MTEASHVLIFSNILNEAMSSFAQLLHKKITLAYILILQSK